MKFTIDRQNLLEALTEYSNILKENPVKPILASVFIEASNGVVTFMGTNTEIDLVKKYSCDIEKDGSVAIKPALLFEYIKLLDKEKVSFEKKDSLLNVENAEFSILDDENYPKIMESVSMKLVDIIGSRFISLIDKSKFAAAQSTDNTAINCLRLIFESDNLKIVSTDSYRLLYLNADIACDLNKEISIPLETVNIISKLLKDYNKNVSIEINGDEMLILWDNTYFACKLTSLEFPNYKNIISNDNFTKTMEFNRSELKSALKIVMTVAKTSVEAKYGGIFKFLGKNLNINAFSGKAKANKKVNMIKEGEDFTSSLNCKYLYEFIDNIEKNVIIKGINEKSMFKITEEGNDNYVYILMPLALKN